MEGKTIFDCSMDEITYELVDQFLSEAQRESTRLDYKQPENGTIGDRFLEPITAMSNGVGGIILLGVSDDQSKPSKWPLLRQKVGRAAPQDAAWSRIAAKIQPRPVVHMRLVAPSESENGILVIRVEPGPMPPYWHADQGILVRHGDQNRPAELATIRYLLERQPPGNFALQQAQERDRWPAEKIASNPEHPVLLRLLTGPQHAVSRPIMPSALDRVAVQLFTGGQLSALQGEKPSEYGENFIYFAKGSPAYTVWAYEVRAYADGMTIWSIPVPPRDKFSLEVAALVDALQPAVALSVEWLKQAIEGYTGPIFTQLHLQNLTQKSVIGSFAAQEETALLPTEEEWTGGVSFAADEDYLPPLKTLLYRFLRKMQVPWLEEEANKLFDHWRSEP